MHILSTRIATLSSFWLIDDLAHGDLIYSPPSEEQMDEVTFPGL
jgi:hypothetical protein